jgi:oryzin
VLAAYNQGILSVVAAGNDDQPAAHNSPARLPQAFTVGMTQPDRRRVHVIDGIFGSSYGPELDVFAPGRDIVSASNLSDGGNRTETGTSMAAPLVAGLVCYLRGLEGGGSLGTPDEVTGRILELAIPGVVGDPKGSPNLLVNNGSGR